MNIFELENGNFRVKAACRSLDLCTSEAWSLLLKLAEKLGVDGIPLGMLHILKEEGPQYWMSAEHDQIWFGGRDDETSPDDASDDMKAYMDTLDWFIDEDSWSHFV
jgi:hypothetical protein